MTDVLVRLTPSAPSFVVAAEVSLALHLFGISADNSFRRI
jgi:hypothetical protein